MTKDTQKSMNSKEDNEYSRVKAVVRVRHDVNNEYE